MAHHRLCLAVSLALVLVMGGGSAHAEQPANVPVTPNEPLAFQGPSLAVDPVRPGRLAIAFQEGISIRTCYLALSEDGGRQWRTVALFGRGGRFPLRDKDVCWKPMLAYGPDGALYYVFQNGFLTRAGGREVMISASRDGGQTFDPPRAIFPEPQRTQNFPSIAVDQRDGRVYVSWTSLMSDPPTGPHATVVFSGGLRVTSSADGGRTFSEPVEADPLHRATTWASQLGVGPDGRLYIASSATAGTDPDAMVPRRALLVATSTDQGRSFRSREVGSLYAQNDSLTPHGLARLFAMAPGHAPGEVHVGWWRRVQDKARILFSTSKDGAVSWSAPRVVGVPDGAEGHHQHRPWFAVEPGGRLHLVYYDRDGRRGPQHVYAIRSDDGGRSFSMPQRLTDVASDSEVGPAGEASGGAPSFGDFLAAAAPEGGLMTAWTDSRRGTRVNAKQDIFFTGRQSRLAREPATDAPAFRFGVSPGRTRVGTRTLFRFRASVPRAGRKAPLAGVRIHFAGRRVRSGRDGLAEAVVQFQRPGRYPVQAHKRGFRRAVAWVVVGPARRSSGAVRGEARR